MLLCQAKQVADFREMQKEQETHVGKRFPTFVSAWCCQWSLDRFSV